MRNLAFIFSAIISFVLLVSFASNNKKKKYHYLGQTAPPDMEFIPGNDSIPSFFISKSQETNLNYSIYLDWLERVYVDYPEIAKAAQPHDIEQGLLYNYNDPILRGNQLRNPAFAYYPVTGVDWLQVQDYLGWKTDRLNESILINRGYYKVNFDQVNEDNFNLEAYLTGQYEGKIKKERKDESVKGGKRLLRIDDGILMLGYRLPTEAEWEYAALPQFANNHLSKGEKYPYGKKYFLFTHTFKYGYKLAGKYEPSDLNRVKGATTYKNHFYGIYNMGNNVKEWLHDEFSESKKSYADKSSIFTDNGFKFPKNDSNEIKKDHKGHLPYRIMDVKHNGENLKILRYQYHEDYYILSPNPDSLTIREVQKHNIKGIGFRGVTIPLYYKFRQFSYYDRQKWKQKGFYKTKEIGRDTFRYYLDTLALLNSPEFVEDRRFLKERKTRPYYINDTITRNRVVKSGTWRNPSTTARESMKETDASADVGFRTILPYTGIPTRFKVKLK